MKILKKRKPRKWLVEIECSGFGHDDVGCRSLLELKRSDLIPIYTEETKPRLISLYFTCPVCKGKTNIGMDYWPKTLDGIGNQYVDKK
jgi:hypothetical protein